MKNSTQTVVTNSAGIIKSFIEDYPREAGRGPHLSQRFEQAGKLIELTTNLRAQHAMGRGGVDGKESWPPGQERRLMKNAACNRLAAFKPHVSALTRHEKRYVLFPGVATKIVSKHEYDAMGRAV